MSAVRVVMNSGRPGGRLYVCDRRCHHGAIGAACVAASRMLSGLERAIMAGAGLVLMYHDRGDFTGTFWVRDR